MKQRDILDSIRIFRSRVRKYAGKAWKTKEKENNALEAVLENEKYDLETVYQMAVGVLGMVYPNNNEVIYYNNESEGYFRQYQDIPE